MRGDRRPGRRVAHSLSDGRALFLVPRFAGKDLIEIGTRGGDGITCYAQLTRPATAIELSERYCKALERRSIALQRPAAFNVTCQDYRQAATLDADVVTWWEQPPLRNDEVLLTLHNELLNGRLRPTAEAVLLFDPKYPSDVTSFRVACVRSRSGALASPRRLCDRAYGFFLVAGVAISDRRIPRHLRNGSTLWAGSRLERENERSSCALRHEMDGVGWRRRTTSS